MLLRLVPRGPAGPGACPVCRERLATPPEVACPACHVGLHAECHALLLRCPTLGCRNAVRAFRGVTRALVLERWEVFQRLRRDRHGTSVRAHDAKAGVDVELYYLDTVATRAIDAAVLERLEAAAAGDVEGGVRVLGGGLDPQGRRPFLVRELVPGEPLPALLRRRGPLITDEVLALGAALLAYLERLHAAGQTHGGVAADRLLVVAGPDDGPDALRVSGKGFGLHLPGGREPGPGEAPSALLPSPERLGGGPASPADDVWAAGVVLYTALAGRPPIEARDAMMLLRRRLTGQPCTPLREHIPRLAPALATALEALLAPASTRPSAASARRVLEGLS